MIIVIKGKPVRIRYSHPYCDVDKETDTIGLDMSEKVFLRKKRSQETCRY